MEYINVRETAEKWGLTQRRVQDMCKRGEIYSAVRFGRAWMIPKDAKKPDDRRTREQRKIEAEQLPHLPMPKKNPCLIYTDLYSTPGTAEAVVASFENEPEAQRILRAQFEYERGNVDAIYADIQYFLKAHSGFNAIISAGILLSRCAIWRGDINLWHDGRRHLFEAPCESENDRQTLAFWVAVLDGAVRDIRDFPEWFTSGRFDPLPPESYPTARMFYAKYLFILAHELAVGKLSLRDVDGLGLVKTLPYIIEPMLSQAKIEKTLLPEIHLRLMLATVYHNLGDNRLAVDYIDRAIKLCLPDGLFNPLLEYRRGLDHLLDERLERIAPEALKKLKAMHRQMNRGWVKIHNILLERNVSSDLTVREREVAKLAAFGYKNQEIAERLHMELSSVKSFLFSAMNKVGAERRSELGLYI